MRTTKGTTNQMTAVNPSNMTVRALELQEQMNLLLTVVEGFNTNQ